RLAEIHVPESERRRALWRRRLDRGIAIFAGAGVALISWAVMVRPPVEGVSRFFVEKAYEEAGGRNVVNVILVDFRAFDTFGEITVLGVVGLTVDRKSTRLNSSHVKISYAVFCLKKKKTHH